MATSILLDQATTTGAGFSTASPAPHSAIQVYGTTTSGTGSATVNVEVRNAGGPWMVAGTISLSLSTTATGDGFVMDAGWHEVRANVTAISGTGATVSVTMGGN